MERGLGNDSISQDEGDSIGSAGSLAQPRGVAEVWGEEGELSGATHASIIRWTKAVIIPSTPDSEEDDSAEFTSLTMFLAAIGLHDWAPKVKQSKVTYVHHCLAVHPGEN